MAYLERVVLLAVIISPLQAVLVLLRLCNLLDEQNYLRSPHPIVIVVLDAIRLSTVAGERMMVAGRWPHHRLEALPAVRARRLAAVRRPGNASFRRSVQGGDRKQLGF